jgi:hypothetical protein
MRSCFDRRSKSWNSSLAHHQFPLLSPPCGELPNCGSPARLSSRNRRAHHHLKSSKTVTARGSPGGSPGEKIVCHAVPACAASSSSANPVPQILSGTSFRFVPDGAAPCQTVPKTPVSLWGSRGREFESRRPDHLQILINTGLQVFRKYFWAIWAVSTARILPKIMLKKLTTPAARIYYLRATRHLHGLAAG